MKRQHIGMVFWFQGVRFVVASAADMRYRFHDSNDYERPLIRVICDHHEAPSQEILSPKQDSLYALLVEWPSDEQLSRLLGFRCTFYDADTTPGGALFQLGESLEMSHPE